MFNVNFLNRLREAELELVMENFRPGARILDFGAGTGAQASYLTARGYNVVAIDLPASGYGDSRVFPIIDYDGGIIPLPDASIDIVFSSNVLEHVDGFGRVMAEFRRVLREGGYCVHLMPSVPWRAWTFLAGLPTAVTAAGRLAADFTRPPAGVTRAQAALQNLKTGVGALIPIGHGTSPEGVSELWTFSATCWRSKFEAQRFRVLRWYPLGLFHTGHMVLGPRFSIQQRRCWSARLGSAANVFVVEPE
ncbi:MAG: class I SAM-dependent methyltransferase [Betaproteobacteria bacterium]|nr:class I SAM-dependent methyltransferase [Betaproteobacteria bacterium]